MTFLTRFVDAATKLTSEGGGGGVGDVLNLEGRDNDASGPAVKVGSDEEENQVQILEILHRKIICSRFFGEDISQISVFY